MLLETARLRFNSKNIVEGRVVVSIVERRKISATGIHRSPALKIAAPSDGERTAVRLHRAKARMEQQAQAQAIELGVMPTVISTAGVPIGSTSAAIADVHFARKSYASTLLAAAKRKRTDTQGSQPRQRRCVP